MHFSLEILSMAGQRTKLRRFTLLPAIFLLLTGCVNNVMPEPIEKIVEMSQDSPEHLRLHLEIKTVDTDSLLVQIFLGNSSENADTLYHSSSFPLTLKYIGTKKLGPPFEKLVFFDDLNTTVVQADSKKLISRYQTKKLSSTPYKIISLFRYSQDEPDNNSQHFWLASDPVEIN